LPGIAGALDDAAHVRACGAVDIFLAGIAWILHNPALVLPLWAVDIGLTGQCQGGEERHEKQGEEGSYGFHGSRLSHQHGHCHKGGTGHVPEPAGKVGATLGAIIFYDD